MNAAPLKRIEIVSSLSVLVAFRVPMNAAPLKRTADRLGHCSKRRFPRSYERGPIEARVALVVSSLAKPFPRSYERGPIEA